MRAFSIFAACVTLTVVAGSASAQDVDWKKVDESLGRTAAVSGDVHRYGFPRSDLQVTLDGVTIRPALALGGWVAFKPAHAMTGYRFESRNTPAMRLRKEGLDLPSFSIVNQGVRACFRFEDDIAVLRDKCPSNRCQTVH